MAARYNNDLHVEIRQLIARSAATNADAVALRGLSKETRGDPVDNVKFVDRLAKVLTLLFEYRESAHYRTLRAVVKTPDNYHVISAEAERDRFTVRPDEMQGQVMNTGQVLTYFGHLSGRVSKIRVYGYDYFAGRPVTDFAVTPEYLAPDFELEFKDLLV